MKELKPSLKSKIKTTVLRCRTMTLTWWIRNRHTKISTLSETQALSSYLCFRHLRRSTFNYSRTRCLSMPLKIQTKAVIHTCIARTPQPLANREIWLVRARANSRALTWFLVMTLKLRQESLITLAVKLEQACKYLKHIASITHQPFLFQKSKSTLIPIQMPKLSLILSLVYC